MTQIHLFISDMHIGSTVALCPPEPHLDGGRSHTLSSGQRMLWHYWEELLEQARRAPAPLYIHLVGDIVETDLKSRTNQVITRNKADILQMALDTLEPLAREAQGLFIYRGTEAHTGNAGEFEEDLAKDFTNTIGEPGSGNHTWYVNLLRAEGVTFEIKHHPPGGGGGRPSNEYAIADRFASDTMLNYTQQGRRPPDLCVAAHLHRYKDSFAHFKTRAIILPAWSLKTSHTHRMGTQQLSQVGGVFITVDDGNYRVYPIIHELERLDYYECV